MIKYAGTINEPQKIGLDVTHSHPLHRTHGIATYLATQNHGDTMLLIGEK